METRRNYTRQKKAYAPKVSEQGKLQPQDKELEEAVLGALMLEKDAYTTVCDILKPECFYEPTNQLIYSAISRLGAQQRPIDMLTVTEQLRLDGKLDEVGGALRISELTGRVASAAHIEYHARIVAQKYLARELIEFSSEILNKAFDETNDVDDLMQEAEGKLFEISQRNLKKDVTQIDPVLSEAIRQIQIAANRSDGLSGLQTGFHDIDKITSGWQNSDLIIIAAELDGPKQLAHAVFCYHISCHGCRTFNIIGCTGGDILDYKFFCRTTAQKADDFLFHHHFYLHKSIHIFFEFSG